jgi:hypothetical protein
MGWDPSDGHRSAYVLELLDLSCDLLEDVGARSPFGFGYRLDGRLVVRIDSYVSPFAVSIRVFFSNLQC